MVTILLQTIIELLTGWKDSFFTWANEVGDKIAAIKTNTDSLPGIKADTADIKDNTAAVITPISNINTNVSAITPDVASIKADTLVIKNNANAIMTSSGQTAAFAEDIADNTLDCSNRLVTIGSDTTQIRADSGSLAADVSEIKNTLGLYLYNTIVTEDAEGAIANFDTDLKDYLQNAVVTIPADAGGIAGFTISHAKKNLFNWDLITPFNVNVTLTKNAQSITVTNNNSYTVNFFNGATFLFKKGVYTFSVKNNSTAALNLYKSGVYYATVFNAGSKKGTVTIPNDEILTVSVNLIANATMTIEEIQIEYGSSATSFEEYEAPITNTITFGSSITDGAEVDLLSGIVKINTSPVTYDSITPLAIRTFKGVNNIYSDIGDMSVTYRETLKHYLEKQDNNSRSLNRNVNLLRENIESNEDSDRREI